MSDSLLRNNQPSRQGRPTSINRHAPSPPSPLHRTNRVATASRTTGRLALYSCARSLKRRRRRNKRELSERRRRTRPRSRPNGQSGAPIGGDQAVPGDQPTSPLPPEEVQFQTADNAESVQVPVHIPCIPACDSCQSEAPTRWKTLRETSENPKTELCTKTKAGISNEPQVNSESALVTGPSDAVVPPTATGFYFGTSSRQSWPHTVASAEYFTVLSNRRMKHLDPSLPDDNVTTMFESQEQHDDPSDMDDNQAANEATTPACGGAYPRRSSRQRRQRNPSSRTTRLRRTKIPESSSSKFHVSVVQVCNVEFRNFCLVSRTGPCKSCFL